MARQNRKGLRSGATARRPKVVVSGEPTQPHMPIGQRMANARQFLDRRRQLGTWIAHHGAVSVQRE